MNNDKIRKLVRKAAGNKGGGGKWIQKATKRMEEKGTKGSLTRIAKAAGKSIPEFCAGSHSGKVAKKCSFAKAVGAA